ncbi:short-chain dehydrogenease/reductase-like protein [Dinothrombium tinctorium]|uniref:Short-chain dehydrogenease/reductase-like protein n=1 Tax=Dinothrombium tinctorium TaxID=1965070 RepID=A0A443QG24_9ACAR|nr:short-chain dehydrogenease/reductase-like protein [Dinothrombium tinctorium]
MPSLLRLRLVIKLLSKRAYIHARDADSGINGAIRYEILAHGDDASSKFYIDPVTGVVRSMVTFALEGEKMYGFDVKATDREGSETENSAVINVFTTSITIWLQIAADLENLEEIRKIVSQTIDHYNQIDVFVCNIAMKDKLYEILDENILKCFEAAYSRRIRAATYLAHLVLPYLIETKGNMIIVSSAASSIPLTGGTLTLIPHMCDASFDMLSKTLACEFGSKGVRVNTVNPNVVNTESNYTLLPDPKQVKAILEKAVQKTALKKLIEPEDVAKCIVFLASNAASFITGHSLVVDGGFLYK